MKAEDLAENLISFGLERGEALAYFHLSRLGPSAATVIAKAAKVPRTDVYRILGSLETKGFVERTLEKPARFVPVPIEDALARAIEARTRETSTLAESRAAVVAAWPSASERAAPTDERVSVTQGRAQVQGLLRRLVSESRDEVLIVALKRSLARFEGLLEALTERTRAGARVKVLAEVDRTNLEAATAFAKVCEVRHLDLPAYDQMLVSDTQGIALFVAVDPLTSMSGAGETALHLTSKDFILSQVALFDMLWTRALPFEARAHQLATGEVPEQVDILRGRLIRNDKMKEVLYRAKGEVRFAIAADDRDLLQEPGIAALMQKKAASGARVRLLVDGKAPAWAGLETKTSRRVARTLLLVDGAEVVGAMRGGSDARGEGKWAFWVTLRSEVKAMADDFDRMWDATPGA